MTRLVVTGIRGPAFREPRSLVEQLAAGVDYISEKQRQEELAECVDSDKLPSEYTLAEVHGELSRVVSRG